MIKSPKTIKIFIGIMLIFICSFLIAFLKDTTGNQAEIFFRKTENYMADFTNNVLYSCDNDPYNNKLNGEKEKPYLPLNYVMLNKVCRIGNYNDNNMQNNLMKLANVFTVVVSLIMFVQIFYYLKEKLTTKILLTTILLVSGIFLFAFERGNLILLAVSLTMFYLFNYKSKNKVVREISFIALALASGLKGYPALFGLLLLFDKRYKDAIKLIIYGILFCIIPFFFLEGGISNISNWLRNINLNHSSYQYVILNRYGYYGFLQYFALNIPKSLLSLASKINYIIVISAIALSFFQENNFKKITLISCSIILIPLTACDYFALYLFPSIVMFFNKKEYSIEDIIYFILFGMLLCPFQIFVADENISFIIKNAAVICLFLKEFCSVIIIFINKKILKSN